jgi:hypothetical protein
MSAGEKFLSDDGALTINADSAEIGDLAAFTTLSVHAGSITLLGRPESGFDNNGRKDLGLGFVAQVIDFGNASLSFAPGGPQVATFATRQGIPFGVRRDLSNQGITFVTMDDLANQFHQAGSTFAVGVFGSLSEKQPIANGSRIGDVAQVQPVIIETRPEPILVEQSTTITAAVKEALDRMSIRPRDATAEENESMSLLRGLLRQPIEGRAVLLDDEYKVVVNRLVNEEVERVLESYLTLTSTSFEEWDPKKKKRTRPSPSEFLELAVSGQLEDARTLAEVYDKPAKLAAALDNLVQAYRVDDPNRDLDGFLEWLQGERSDKTLGADAAKLAGNLDNMARLVDRLAKIGLTKKEFQLSKQFVLESIAGNYPELVAKLSGEAPMAAVVPKVVGKPADAETPLILDSPSSADPLAPGATPPGQPAVQPPAGSDVPPPPPGDVPPPPPGAAPQPPAAPNGGASPVPPPPSDAAPVPPGNI